jgi:ABC-2 type transport system permease protein
MMGTLVWKLFRDVRTALIVIALLLFGFQILWVKVTQRAVTQISPFFTTIAERAGVAAKVIEEQLFSGPGKIVQMIAGGENMHFERAPDMLSIAYVHPLVQIILCIWAIGRAALALAGELDRGTLELLLAQPIPRGRVVLAHLIVDVLTIPLLAACIWLGTYAGYQMLGPFEVNMDEVQKQFAMLPFPVVVNPEFLKVNVWAFAPAVFNIMSLMFAVSGLTMAISATGRFRGKVLGVAVVTFLVMFLVNVIGQLWDTIGSLRPATVFYYYQPQRIVLSGKWDVTLPIGQVNGTLVLFAVGVVGYLLAWVRFRSRDLPAPL